ncbi:MAG TPA: DUF4920 domain-containing protein [Candidatus Limnocylindria bacterium]|nr:DUF4920 domain-containing protein [Candidatus Limnocylindria bacterium]
MRFIHILASTCICIGALAGSAVAHKPGQTGTTAGSAPVSVGSKITAKKSVKVDQLAKQPERYVGQTIRLEGTVKKVCQGTGCWVEVEGAKGATFLAKSLDESVLLPMDSAGRKIVVQGTVMRHAAKGHDHEHAHAHGEGEEGHVCPTPTYLLSTQGATLK